MYAGRSERYQDRQNASRKGFGYLCFLRSLAIAFRASMAA
jgi:hypothetical protein